jgi:hypothetical protein
MKPTNTTLRELIKNLNEKNITEPSYEKLFGLFKLDFYYVDYDKLYKNERLKCYFIKKWYCTDTYVGLRAYFLDNELICFSNQAGRKMDEEFHFISIDFANKMKIFLETFSIENIFSNIELIDDGTLDEIIKGTFKIKYNSQILHEEAYYGDKKVKIIKTNFPFNSEHYFHGVLIEVDNKQIMVNCKDLNFEFNQ